MLLDGAFAETPLDTSSLSKGQLDITNRVRTNPLPWTGQFSPQLVEALLRAFAPDGCRVLDPFVGSGTALLEAGSRRLPAVGVELNPAALILSQVYELINSSDGERKEALAAVRSGLQEEIGSGKGPLFGERAEDMSRTDIESSLVEIWRQCPPGPAQKLAAALVVLVDFHRKHIDREVIHRTWTRLSKTVRALPHSDEPIEVHHADARCLPLADDSVDLVLTSPPYINVFNYHQKFRRSVEALDWEVLPIARSEIGSNRQNRGNRFLTVIQYCLDMTAALWEAARVTRREGRLILVVGRESSVRGTPFYNGALVAELGATALGLDFSRRQERVFQNRYGLDIYEDILHFLSPAQLPAQEESLEVARSIAMRALSSAEALVPDKERDGLLDALDRASDVTPSPLLPPSALAPTL